MSPPAKAAPGGPKAVPRSPRAAEGTEKEALVFVRPVGVNVWFTVIPGIMDAMACAVVWFVMEATPSGLREYPTLSRAAAICPSCEPTPSALVPFEAPPKPVPIPERELSSEVSS